MVSEDKPVTPLSIFSIEPISPDQWVRFKAKLLSLYEPSTDSLRFYKLGKNWRHRVEHHGAKEAIDIFEDTLIV